MIKIAGCFFLFVLVFSGYAQKAKLPVISKAEELNIKILNEKEITGTNYKKERK